MFKDALLDMEEKLKYYPNRIKHIIGVFETALKLGEIYDVDIFHLGLAAIYHDYHKYDSEAFFKTYLGVDLYRKYEDYQVLYHAFAGAKTLKIKYPNLSNDAYLAIQNHVFGAIQMSTLEKIVFVSDYCEPSRKFLDTKFIFDLASKNINESVLYCINLTIEDLKRRNLKIHEDQFKIKKYYEEVVYGNGK